MASKLSTIHATSSATIASGAALSGAVFLGEKVLCGLQMPAGWDAASITFQVSHDDGTSWQDLHDDAGNEVTISSPAAGEYRLLDPALFSSSWLFKVRSGVSASAVNQTADRVLTLITRKYFPRG